MSPSRLPLVADGSGMQRSEDKPASRRLARVALLPDCHIRPGADDIPQRPARRLYGAARTLLTSTLQRMPGLDVDAVLLLGDTLDPADDAGIAWLRALMERSQVPVHAIVGNHECYGRISPERFHRALGLPAHGNYVLMINDVPFFMLATPDQSSLAKGTTGYRWLEQALQELNPDANAFCCAHFSLLLHPCVEGPKNDGMQVLWGASDVLALLAKFPQVRAWIAGHKNIPSKVVQRGLLHLLSPQLIQAPCAVRVIDIHPDGICSRVFPIEQRAWARLSEVAYGPSYSDRHGQLEDRDFWWSWVS